VIFGNDTMYGQLLWNADRNSCTIYRIVPFSVTLDNPNPYLMGTFITWRWISQKRYKIET